MLIGILSTYSEVAAGVWNSLAASHPLLSSTNIYLRKELKIVAAWFVFFRAGRYLGNYFVQNYDLT